MEAAEVNITKGAWGKRGRPPFRKESIRCFIGLSLHDQNKKSPRTSRDILELLNSSSMVPDTRETRSLPSGASHAKIQRRKKNKSIGNIQAMKGTRMTGRNHDAGAG